MKFSIKYLKRKQIRGALNNSIDLVIKMNQKVCSQLSHVCLKYKSTLALDFFMVWYMDYIFPTFSCWYYCILHSHGLPPSNSHNFHIPKNK